MRFIANIAVQGPREIKWSSTSYGISSSSSIHLSILICCVVEWSSLDPCSINALHHHAIIIESPIKKASSTLSGGDRLTLPQSTAACWNTSLPWQIVSNGFVLPPPTRPAARGQILLNCSFLFRTHYLPVSAPLDARKIKRSLMECPRRRLITNGRSK